MHTAGWLDVWNLAMSIVGRQEPFVAIMLVTFGVFVVVMAIEGVRTSLLSIWHNLRSAPEAPALAPPPAAPQEMASLAPAQQTRNFSSGFAARVAATPPRRPKPLTMGPRQFRTPRPTIRRHPQLDFGMFAALPENTAMTALELREAV